MRNKKFLIVIFFSLIVIIAIVVIVASIVKYSDKILIVPERQDISKSSSDDYWSYLEWQDSFPEQKELINNFNSLVQDNGIALTINISRQIKIAIVYPALQASDYWVRNVKAFEARLEESGVPYTTEKYYSKPGETRLQHQQLQTIIESDFDYLITSLDESADISLFEHILTEGKIKLILQNITTPLKRFGSNQPLLYTGFDHEEGSLQLAKRFIERFPSGANGVLLLFTDGVVSRERGGTFKRVMDKNDKMHLLSIYKTEGSREKSKIAILNAFNENQNIDFIYSCATDISLGVIDALETLKTTNSIFVNGWGGGDIELDLISKNMLDITVMRMNDDTAIAMAEAIKLDLQNEQEKIPLVFSGAFEIVNPSMKEKIESLKIRAFRYSSKER